MRRQADRFMTEIERATRLEDAYHAAMRLPSSPYNRLLREGVNFFSELKPGSLKGGSKGDAAAPSGAPTTTLTATQLEALRMVLAKEVAAERDSAARFVPWLATFGSVSPLLGLLGTVLGVMDAFIGIALGGSGNIAAVAPGVAEALVTTVAGPATVVTSASATPGATAAMFPEPPRAIPMNASITPSTVPSRPSSGLTEPNVASHGTNRAAESRSAATSLASTMRSASSCVAVRVVVGAPLGAAASPLDPPFRLPGFSSEKKFTPSRSSRL